MPGVLARYQESEFAREHESLLRDLRAAMDIDPAAYRGIARDPLRPLRGAQLPLVRPEHFAARVRMGELCDDDEMLPDEKSAREVFGLLGDENFEVIRSRVILSRGDGEGSPARMEGIPRSARDDTKVLGYDIGDHFSVIADVAITPRLHPPHPDDFQSIAARLRNLNENLLFDTPAAARAFLEYYRTCDWAEASGDLAVLEVSCIE